jgi:hypothetical protein
MSPQQLLGEIRRRGISISVHDGKLRLTPAELLDADLKNALVLHKSTIIELLVGPAMGPDGWPLEQCRICGCPNFWTCDSAPGWHCSHCDEHRPQFVLVRVIAGGEWGLH